MNKKYILFFLLLSCTMTLLLPWYFFTFKNKGAQGEIKVGILHSLTGTMAISEKNLIDAYLLAIEEINNNGGILKKRIKPIIADGKSDPILFAREAEKLITQEKVNVIFGCWTSISRIAVKAVVEKYNNLLFYPLEYEGMEQSKNIIYTGSLPNQQIIPGIIWAYKNLGKRFFLVGSDYLFPHIAHKIIRKVVELLKGEIVGEEYIPLGSTNVASIIEKIIQSNPSVIINTINGDTNISFIKYLREKGIIPEKIPSMFFSTSESDFTANIDLKDIKGDYATWSYFQSIPEDTNQIFVKNFKIKYGDNKAIGDPMETAYSSVYLWAQTVEESQSINIDILLDALKNQKFNAPSGIIYIDNKNNHTWKKTCIGKVGHNKQFTIVWDSKKQVQPLVYPPLKTKNEWKKIMNKYNK